MLMEVIWDSLLFGLRLRKYRKKIKITQAGLAEKAAISTRNLGKLEGADVITWPELLTVMSLAKALGVCTSMLINDMRVPKSEESPDYEAFQTAFCAASEIKQRAVLEMASFILSTNVVAEEDGKCIHLRDMA